MKGFFSFLLTCGIVFLAYCWIGYKFPAVDEVHAYDYNDHTEYVAFVNDPLRLFLNQSGESVQSEAAAVAKAKSQYHSVMDMWIVISIGFVIVVGLIRSRFNDKQKK